MIYSYPGLQEKPLRVYNVECK